VICAIYGGYNCWIAAVEEAAGNPQKADAVLDEAGSHVDCYRFRADGLDFRGTGPLQQKAYGKAVRLAPNLPATYYSWLVALARHGDFNGARSKLKGCESARTSLGGSAQSLGDAPAKTGRRTDALAKYDETMKYALRGQS
jgi:hypothetical protein